MAASKRQKSVLSGKTKVVNLFYDGDKYKEPLYVGINGMNWLIKRGEPVEVPEEVYEVIMNSQTQDGKTARMVKELSGGPQDLGVM